MPIFHSQWPTCCVGSAYHCTQRGFCTHSRSSIPPPPPPPFSIHSLYVKHQNPFYNLLPPPPLLFPHLITALPLLNTTFPPSTLVTNLTSSHPPPSSSSPTIFPILQARVTSLSPGFTGAANRAWNSRRLAGSLLPSVCSSAWAAEFQEKRPCMIVPPKPILVPGVGSAWRGL